VQTVADASSQMIRLFINGVLKAEAPWPSEGLVQTQDATLLLGDKVKGTGWFWQELTLYDRVITATSSSLP
jgi:hypothetical protein